MTNNEFSNKIQHLTTKLSQIGKTAQVSDHFSQTKQKLSQFEVQLTENLQECSRKVKKIQKKLSKRLKKLENENYSISYCEQDSSQNLTDIIHQWIQEIDEKLADSKLELRRQQLVIEEKSLEEQSIYKMQTKNLQSKIEKNLVVLRKEVESWAILSNQQQSQVLQCLHLYQRELQRKKQQKQRSVSKLSEAILEKWEKSKEKLSSKVEQAIRKSKKSNDNIELIMKSLLEMV